MDPRISEKTLEYGVSWCETGMTSKGEKTTICGNCIYCDPDKCDIINDEINQ